MPMERAWFPESCVPSGVPVASSTCMCNFTDACSWKGRVKGHVRMDRSRLTAKVLQTQTLKAVVRTLRKHLQCLRLCLPVGTELPRCSLAQMSLPLRKMFSSALNSFAQGCHPTNTVIEQRFRTRALIYFLFCGCFSGLRPPAICRVPRAENKETTGVAGLLMY